MNAVIYARFSSAGQREESIEGQIRECTSYANKKGYTIIETYIDRALSATTDRRPAFQKMIDDSGRGLFGVVLCYKHDRFARNRYDAAHYKAVLSGNNVALEYAAEAVPAGPEGILIDSVMEGFAEYYSANLSQNVKRGQYDSALKRYTLGVRVFGLQEGPDRRFELSSESPVVAQIFEEYAAGKPATEICDELNARGLRTTRGTRFSRGSISKIIRNEKYKGVYKFADIYDEHGVPAIVSPELWQAANDMAALHAEAPARSSLEGGYLLTGKLFCGECGSPMTAAAGTGKSGRRYEYYACNNHRAGGGCGLKNVRKEETENRVVDILKKLVFSNEVIYAYADHYVKWQEVNAHGVEVAMIEANVASVEAKIANITESLMRVPSLTLAQKLADLERDRAELLLEADRIKTETPRFSRDDIVFFLKSFRAGDNSTPEWRAYVVNTFLNAAYIYGDGRISLKLNYANGIKTNKTETAEQRPPEGSSFGAVAPPMVQNLNTTTTFYWSCGFLWVNVSE